MRKWLLIGGAGAVVGYVAVYFALDVKPTPEPEPTQPVASAPAEPVVLSEVVDVTNLDPLLEPRVAEPTGLPFDTTAPSELSIPVRELAPIPHAADESEESGAVPKVDPNRAVWYGAERLPRQLSEFPPQEVWRPHGQGWIRSHVDPVRGTVGIGYFF
jgi:hypothetical protein